MARDSGFGSSSSEGGVESISEREREGASGSGLSDPTVSPVGHISFNHIASALDEIDFTATTTNNTNINSNINTNTNTNTNTNSSGDDRRVSVGSVRDEAKGRCSPLHSRTNSRVDVLDSSLYSNSSASISRSASTVADEKVSVRAYSAGSVRSSFITDSRDNNIENVNMDVAGSKTSRGPSRTVSMSYMSDNNIEDVNMDVLQAKSSRGPSRSSSVRSMSAGAKDTGHTQPFDRRPSFKVDQMPLLEERVESGSGSVNGSAPGTGAQSSPRLVPSEVYLRAEIDSPGGGGSSGGVSGSVSGNPSRSNSLNGSMLGSRGGKNNHTLQHAHCPH